MNVNNMIILTVFTMLALAHVSRTALVEDNAGHSVDCSSMTTCTGCTESGACHWSGKRQVCVQPSMMWNVIAIRPSDCPRIQVMDRTVADDEYEYRVRVTRDNIGLLTYLKNSANGIACVWEKDVRSPGRVVPDPWLNGTGGEIVCDPVQRSQFGNVADLPFVRHFRVAFGVDNVTLRLDADTDYYTAFYRTDCGRAFDDFCVNCLWTDDKRRYYLKTCSAINQCALKPSMKLVYVNSQYLKDDGDDASRELAWPKDVQTQCNRDIAITSFEPTRAAWNVDPATTMTINVKNLAVLIERFFVWEVTVAGKICKDVRLRFTNGSNDHVTDTIVCKLSGGNPGVISTGPVKVRFVSGTSSRPAAADEMGTSFVVASTASFHFDSPTVTQVTGPACGSLRGGATITVTGTGFAASRNVSVFVYPSVAGPRIPCAVTKREDRRLTCVTRRSATPSVLGHLPTPVSVEFDMGLVLYAPSRFSFRYVEYPELAAAQTLSGIASGNTGVWVHWRGLSCIDESSVRFYVQRVDGRRNYADCLMADSTLMACRSPDVYPLTVTPTPEEENDPDDAPVQVERFSCGFEMVFAGQPFRVPCDPSTTYYAYANPVFAGFELDRSGSAVVILGRNAGLGYTVDDVSVMLPLADPVECDIWHVSRDRVECWPHHTAVGLEGLQEVWVTVGHAPPSVVPRLM